MTSDNERPVEVVDSRDVEISKDGGWRGVVEGSLEEKKRRMGKGIGGVLVCVGHQAV